MAAPSVAPPNFVLGSSHAAGQQTLPAAAPSHAATNWDGNVDKPEFAQTNEDGTISAAQINPDEQKEDNDPITLEERMQAAQLKATGQLNALRQERPAVEKPPREILIHYETAYEAMQTWWSQGMTEDVQNKFTTTDQNVVMANYLAHRDHNQFLFPWKYITDMFTSYREIHKDIVQTPSEQQPAIAKKYLEGNKMFMIDLRQRGINYKRLLTAEVYDTMKKVLEQHGDSADFSDIIAVFQEPTVWQQDIIQHSHQTVEQYFRALGASNYKAAEPMLAYLHNVNQQLRDENKKHGFKEDDHNLPLEELDELWRECQAPSGKYDENGLVEFAQKSVANWEIFCLKDVKIPNFTALEPTPEVKRQQQYPIRRILLQYHLDTDKPPFDHRGAAQKIQKFAQDFKGFGSQSPPQGLMPSNQQGFGGPSPPQVFMSSNQQQLGGTSGLPMQTNNISENEIWDEGMLMIHPRLSEGITPQGKVMFVLADARSRGIHPDTAASLSASDKDQTPWLFGDGSDLEDSAYSTSFSGGQNHTKLINDDDDEIVADMFSQLSQARKVEPPDNGSIDTSGTKYPVSTTKEAFSPQQKT
ncbi:hypothetical protein GTA08_BOTSDO01544 [Botryosphaeria dothidea]|uniref:Uncharacterized protein n=1 Tax=Botryosphaeria dothidea TaxID=55169 RepID=A0A8H4JAL1_9PEZI|nr:hypothetical protein GTA08_BOTSDO01544 [Botryosphaeria dothidea]